MSVIEDKLNELRLEAEKTSVPILRIETSKLLKQEVLKNNPKKILEIGTAIGYSGILMLSCSEDSMLTTIEKDEDSAVIARKNFEEVNLGNRVEILTGDAKEFLPTLNSEFDFIFLDGPKGQYVKYLPFLLKLLKVGGVLFSDNVLYRGMVNGKVEIKKNKRTLVNNLRLFLSELENNKNLKNEILEIEDGVSITHKIN